MLALMAFPDTALRYSFKNRKQNLKKINNI